MTTTPEPDKSGSRPPGRQFRTVAALGSSFAAGPTIEPVVDVAAMRSSRNYPHLLAAALGAHLVDLTVSGATTANILHTPQQTQTGAEFAPQLAGLPEHADLVTVTAGGNDLRFIGSMLAVAWSSHDPDGPVAQMLAQGQPAGVPVVTEADVRAAAQGLAAIVAGVRERAPQARVLLVDYLTVVTPQTPTGDGSPFTAAELAGFLLVQDALVRVYEETAVSSGAELVAVSAISTDHGLGSTSPWVSGFRADLATTAGSFHPNADGMRAVADHLLRVIA